MKRRPISALWWSLTALCIAAGLWVGAVAVERWAPLVAPSSVRLAWLHGVDLAAFVIACGAPFFLVEPVHWQTLTSSEPKWRPVLVDAGYVVAVWVFCGSVHALVVGAL